MSQNHNILDLISRLKNECWRYDEMQVYLPLTNTSNCTSSLRGFYAEKLNDDDYKRDMYLNVCLSCIHRFECKLISYTHRAQKNIIVNHYKNEIEIIYYKQPLNCIDELVNVEVDHSRNYFEINGCLFPKDENLSNAKFLENMDNSARQSRDAFWGYALSNSWDYFITLTTNRMKVDRYDDEQVKRLWRLCRQRIQRFDSNAKILLVPERHEDGALHFHGLTAMERQWVLKPFKIPEQGKLVEKKSATGAPLFDFPFWDFGFASCAIIYTDNNTIFPGEALANLKDENGNIRTTSQRRVVAYLDKYIGKQLGSIGYGQRSFYRTKNVISKEKEVLYWNDEVVFKNCFMNNDMYLYKDNAKCSIFRTKFDGYEDEN